MSIRAGSSNTDPIVQVRSWLTLRRLEHWHDSFCRLLCDCFLAAVRLPSGCPLIVQVRMVDSVFRGNYAARGGAFFVTGTRARLSLINSFLVDNQAGVAGGTGFVETGSLYLENGTKVESGWAPFGRSLFLEGGRAKVRSLYNWALTNLLERARSYPTSSSSQRRLAHSFCHRLSLSFANIGYSCLLPYCHPPQR